MSNRTHLLATLICSGAIVASTNMIAQSYGQDSRERSADLSRNGKVESANSAFKRLDSNQRGFLTQQDVSALQGFDAACDRDADDRITREEFRPCWNTWSRNRTVNPSVGAAPGASGTPPDTTTGTGSTPGTAGSGSTPGTMDSGSSPGTMGSGAGSPGTSPGAGSPGMPGSTGSTSSGGVAPRSSTGTGATSSGGR